MTVKTYQCEFCKRTFDHQNIQNHIQSCIQNPNSEKYKKQNKERTCEKCGRHYTLASLKGSTERFCSRGCANSRSFSEESKKKKAEAQKNFWRRHPRYAKLPEKFCKVCGSGLRLKNKSGYCGACIHLRPFSEETREKLRQSGRKSAQAQKENRRSKIEALFFDKVKLIFADAEPNKVLIDGWDTDIWIPSRNLAVFWNGACHYLPIYGQKNLNQTQNRDKIKKSLFEKNGIKVYIIKDVNESYPKNVKNRDGKTDFQLRQFLEYLKENM